MALVWNQKTQSFVEDGKGMAGGLGSYGNLTNPDGSVIGVDKAAYDAMYGTQADGFSLAKNQGLGVTSPQQTGMFGLTQQDLTGISTIGTGLATGYDLYSNIWGGGKDARDASIRNANAQAAYNEDAAQHKKDFYAGVAKSGLAGQ